MGGLVLESHARRRRERRNSPQMSNRVQRKGSAHAPTAVQKPKRKLFSRSKGKGKKKQKGEQDDDRNEAQDGGRSFYSERDRDATSVESMVEPTEYVDNDSTFPFGFSLNGVYQLGQTYNDAIVSTIFPVQGGDQSVELTVEESVEKVVEQEAKEEECFAEVVDKVVKRERKQEDSIAGVEEIEVVAKQEAKKEECFAEVEEEVIKREAKKKKRGLFGRKKHQQNEAKSHAEEKRELDSVKSPVMSDARDEADQAVATVADQKENDNITSKEEEKENNVDESSCCKDKNAKEMGAKTNTQESNSPLVNRFANKIETIFQLESNSLIENSLKEDATFQAKPVPSPAQDCNAIGKNTEADELQIAKNNTDMEGQEIVGKGDRGDNTVVSFLTQATGQTMWTRYFGPALFSSSEKKETEADDEDDNNVDKSDSFIGSVGGDTDTVVSGLTLASGQTKWTRYKPAESREMEPISEEKEGEESIISKSGQVSGNSGSVADSASKPMSIHSVKSSNNTTTVEEKNSVSSSSAKTNSSGSTAAKTAHSSKIRAEDQDFDQKPLPSSSRSIKSFCRSRFVKSKSSKAKHASSSRSVQSKSSKARSTSRASIAPASNVPASASSVKSSGSSKSSKAKAPSSNATVTSGSNQSFSQDASGIEITRTAPLRPMTAYVSPAMIRRKKRAKEMSVSQQKTDEPSSASSVKSSGGASKSSKAKDPSSNETVASMPAVPSSSHSVKSSGGASKSSRTRPSSRASAVSAPTVPSSSSLVKSSGSSKSSQAKDPSSDETTASIPTVPSISRSVKSSGVASKSSNTRPPSRASAVSAPTVPSSSSSVKSSGGLSNSSVAKAPSSDETTASIPTVPSSSRSVKSSGGASKSSKTRPPSRATSIASAPTVVASAPNQSFSQHVASEIKITRTRTAPLRPMTAYVSPTYYDQTEK